jgi:hypothetical protein
MRYPRPDTVDPFPPPTYSPSSPAAARSYSASAEPIIHASGGALAPAATLIPG